MADNDNLNDHLLDDVEGDDSPVPGRYPNAPSMLNPEQQKLWRRLVRSKPINWFDVTNLPLLTEYVRILWQLDKLNKNIEKVYNEIELDSKELNRLTGMQSKLQTQAGNLATKMRLTQQSQIDLSMAKKKAGPCIPDDSPKGIEVEGEYTVETGEGKKPWEM